MTYKALSRSIAATLAICLTVAPVAPAFATGDAAAGKKSFIQCQICHTAEPGGPNRLGPNLAGVVGSKAASKPGFNYSPALKKSQIVWNAKTLDAWLRKPNALVPGNRMIFAGVSDAGTRANIIAFLSTLKGRK